MPRASQISIRFTPPMECLPVTSIPEGDAWVYELLCGPPHKISYTQSGPSGRRSTGKQFHRSGERNRVLASGLLHSMGDDPPCS